MSATRRGSKTIPSLRKLKSQQALAAATPEEPQVSQRTLDRVTRERDELKKKLDAANKDTATVKTKLRNVTEKIYTTANPGQTYSSTAGETDAADVPEQDIVAMLNKLVPVEHNESLESRLEELETRITLVDGELGKLLRLKMNMEEELHNLVTCQDLESMRDIIRHLWLRSCATKLFAKDSHVNGETADNKKNDHSNSPHQNGVSKAVLENLQPVAVSKPDRKLPAETHIKHMQADLRKLVIQELSLYKISGADWRLFAERVGIPEDLVKQWQEMKVPQPMRNVLSVWAASQAATVRMLHRHLVSPQMRCVVLGKRISDVYEVD